jgi:hypothetical protein
MKDREIRGRLLARFHDRRDSNGGFVPVDEMIIAGTEPVSREAIGRVCRELMEAGLIEWNPTMGQNHTIGHARITARGTDAVERGSAPGIDIQFPNSAAESPKGAGLKRDPRLLHQLLETLEAYPAEYGDAFTLNGDDPLLAVEGFTSGQINYHLEQLLAMGLVEDPGSQPAIGITFSGLTPRGHDLLERTRAASFPSTQTQKTQVMSKKVFLVHGHDDAAKNEVALFLTNIGLEPIILSMRPNAGRHLLAKFQEESKDVSFAVVLMTPDDERGPVGGAQKKRARQNVVFELGFLSGISEPPRSPLF